MTAGAIGSVGSLGGDGRLAVVVSRTPVSKDEDGNQLVQVRYRTIEEASGGEGSRRGGTALGRAPQDLSAQDRAVVNQLQARDAQVRAEENAHTANAGDLAGPTQLTYQRGPDGRLYAVGGSVGISARTLSGTPEELQRIGQRLTAAALAAINPSGADQAVARSGDAVRAYANAANLSARDEGLSDPVQNPVDERNERPSTLELEA